ncbi:MAG TPA: EAL domain-containing protein [Gemmatimonadales bacterium]|nr:EAL domain-containing protein [Gemmatimonadales bacterium]
MTLGRGLLRSRFGRRLVLLFVGCAVVPMALLAVLSWRHMTRQLERQSQLRLHQANRALGRAVFERLLLLEATLKNIPPTAIAELARSALVPEPPAAGPPARTGGVTGAVTRAPVDGRVALGGLKDRRGRAGDPPAPPAPSHDPEASRALAVGLDLLARSRFAALEFQPDVGRRLPVFGRLDRVPALTPAESAFVGESHTLVVTEHADTGAARIYLVRRMDRREARGFFVGEVSPAYLWGTREQGMPSPATHLAVVDDSGHVLFGPPPVTSAWGGPVDDTAATDPAEAGLSSTRVEPEVVASYWPVPIESVFGAPDWIIVLSEPREAVVGPMTDFASTFALIIALCTGVVLLLSMSQIRRSLMPLEELQEGTRRIALRDFDTRVAVTSHDEFAELAESFNSMATRLGRQFRALDTAADIDRAVLSATDATTIVRAVLARLPDVYPCAGACITLFPADRGGAGPSWVRSFGAAGVPELRRVEFAPGELRALAALPEVLELGDGDPLPACVRPLAELGLRSFVVLPLAYQQQLAGVLVLGAADASRTPDDLLHARRLADQVAVALSNARMIDQVRTLAYFDSLTGLLNRAAYKERLARALALAKRDRRSAAAFFIDLDNFGRINDTLGHELGDELLRQVAGRLRACCEAEESGPGPRARPEVARIGGDEFTVLVGGLPRPEDAVGLARRILAVFAPSFQLGQHDMFTTASVGVAVYPEDGEEVETLLAHADTAMYEAKHQGGNGYQLYSRSMNATALQRLTLENDLRRALERDELVLHYQPIVEAATGVIVGAEALVRWRHPSLGLLLPGEFIAIAEENGLIVPLGEWVLRTACAQNRGWQSAGLPPIRVVVNLSGRQLRQGNLIAGVRDALEAAGLEPEWLGLELTESMLMERQHEGVSALQALRAMGIQLSIDDFGTGYSSLSYLKHFPVDTLKIDRCFVRDLASVPDDAAITAAIIAMAHALDLLVVAEGVETEEHLGFLRAQGCDEVQGHLLGRPVLPERFAEWLARPRPVIRSSRRTTGIRSA